MQFKSLSQLEAACLLSKMFQKALKDTGLKSFPLFEASLLKAVYQNDQIVGILLYRELEKGLIEIDFISTLEEFQKTGVGSKVVDKLKGDYDEIWLEVSDQNIPALEFYKKLGFKDFGHIKSYYSNGSGAHRMSFGGVPKA